MGATVSRSEVSGWLQVVIGLVGLYFTVTNSGPALEALSRMGTGQGLPVEFQGAQGFIKVFLLILALSVLIALVLIGLAVLLGSLFKGLGAKNPLHASFSMTAAIFFGSVGVTGAIFGNPVWVFAVLFMLSCLVLTGVAGIDDGEDRGFWPCLFVLGAASVFVGGLSMIPMTAQKQTSALTEGPAAAVGDPS